MSKSRTLEEHKPDSYKAMKIMQRRWGGTTGVYNAAKQMLCWAERGRRTGGKGQADGGLASRETS